MSRKASVCRLLRLAGQVQAGTAAVAPQLVSLRNFSGAATQLRAQLQVHGLLVQMRTAAKGMFCLMKQGI